VQKLLVKMCKNTAILKNTANTENTAIDEKHGKHDFRVFVIRPIYMYFH